VSRGPGRWQRAILDRLRHQYVVAVHDVVTAQVVDPSRSDYVAARRAAWALCRARRVGAGHVTLCSDIECRDGSWDGHRPRCRGALTEFLFVSTITWSQLLWPVSVAPTGVGTGATLNEPNPAGHPGELGLR